MVSTHILCVYPTQYEERQVPKHMEDKQKLMQNVTDLEKQFKQWCGDVGNTGSTPDTYWSSIKTFPYIDPTTQSVNKIIGMVENKASRPGQITAIRRFLKYQLESGVGEELSGEEYTQLKRKINDIIENISLKEKHESNSKSNRVKKHIYPSELLRLLKHAKPERAKFWFVLYDTGARCSDIKRHEPKHLRPELGEHGQIRLIGKEDSTDPTRSKSDSTRRVDFEFPETLEILQNAPTGYYEYKGDEFSNAFYPEKTPQNQKYWIEKGCEEKGLSRHTIHHFRHTRITHLVFSDKYTVNEVKIRSGHGDLSVTDGYTEIDLDRDPVTLEKYCQKKNINIMEVLEHEK